MVTKKTRRKHDLVLPEVRKPGYGTLVAVTVADEDRELWFQAKDTIRFVRVHVVKGDFSVEKPITIRVRGARSR